MRFGGRPAADGRQLPLLREMAQPGLRDLKIDFRGLQTARVYPEELANVPFGSQQILLGSVSTGSCRRESRRADGGSGRAGDAR